MPLKMAISKNRIHLSIFCWRWFMLEMFGGFVEIRSMHIWRNATSKGSILIFLFVISIIKTLIRTFFVFYLHLNRGPFERGHPLEGQEYIALVNMMRKAGRLSIYKTIVDDTEKDMRIPAASKAGQCIIRYLEKIERHPKQERVFCQVITKNIAKGNLQCFCLNILSFKNTNTYLLLFWFLFN